MVAKNDIAHNVLAKQFEDHSIHTNLSCICMGYDQTYSVEELKHLLDEVNIIDKK